MSDGDVTLRAASAEDIEQVWRWNNAPEVRAVSRSQGAISFAEHRHWYQLRLATPPPMWIVESGALAVGVVRIEHGEISIALEGSARGRKIGSRAITLACRRWAKPVVAQIHPANAASRAAFESCGFVLVEANASLLTYRWTP